jgi:iron(III) transport system permease protein
MEASREAQELRQPDLYRRMVNPRLFVMSAILLPVGAYLICPIVLVFVISFNVARHPFVGERIWGLDNWRLAFTQPDILGSILNTFVVWGLTLVISLPIAVLISWVLARTRIKWSNGIEFMFWVSYMMPNLATTLGWIMLMDPNYGALNKLINLLPLTDFSRGPFNIFSMQGIVWANLMGNGLSLKVMLLTPAFRNMDVSLEEAARVSGASNFRTMLRVTFPLMAAPITLVLALQLVRVFQSFETELLLGTPTGFFVFSTRVYELVHREIPLYGAATALASITIIVIAVIIPIQRWILQRRRYTTISSGFKPGLIDLGALKYPVTLGIWFLILMLTVLPVAFLLLGSFMTRAGFFTLNPVFTFRHWDIVLTDSLFINAVRNTFFLGVVAAIVSPLLFSLFAYIIVRTRLPGRGLLDTIIWSSAVIPGILTGLGLLVMFLGTPGLSAVYGTIWALVIVVVIQGKTTGVNVLKGVFVQVGQDMEEAARVSGAGWFRTYYQIWIPLMMKSLVLVGTLSFVVATTSTSSVILLASRDSVLLSILAIDYRLSGGKQEAASIVAIILLLLSVGAASLLRAFGMQMGVRHQ